MSLIVAAWRSPTDYALAADSRATRSGTVIGTVDKSWRVGPWFFGAAGAWPSAWRMKRNLEAYAADPKSKPIRTRADLEDLLSGLFSVTVDEAGPTKPGNFPGVSAWLLIVGPAGLASMGATGEVDWYRPEADGIAYAANGSGETYAWGWMDREVDAVPFDAGIDLADFVRAPVLAACGRFETIGGPIVVHRSQDVEPYPEPPKRPRRARAEADPPSHKPAARTRPPTAPMVQAPVVRALRQRTGATLIECQRALTETSGDSDRAVEWLRMRSR